MFQSIFFHLILNLVSLFPTFEKNDVFSFRFPKTLMLQMQNIFWITRNMYHAQIATTPKTHSIHVRQTWVWPHKVMKQIEIFDRIMCLLCVSVIFVTHLTSIEEMDWQAANLCQQTATTKVNVNKRQFSSKRGFCLVHKTLSAMVSRIKLIHCESFL